MAITPLGFEGSISDVEYSKRSRLEGAQFPVVADRTDFAVSTNTSVDRTVNVAAGICCAHSMMGTQAAQDSIQLDAVTTSGATRWDAVVLRYDWTANTITLVKVNGAAQANAPQVLPAGLATAVGSTFDQVLALVKLTQGQSLPTQVVDMRLFASKVFSIPSAAALPPAAASPYGSEAVVPDGTRYRRLLDSANAPAWLALGGTFSEITGSAVLAPSVNWATSTAAPANLPLVNRALRMPHWRQVDLQLRRTGPELNSDDISGNAPDTAVAQLTAACRPDYDMPVQFWYRSGVYNGLGGTGLLTAGGLLSLQSFSNPGLNLTTETDEVSFRASFGFATRSL